MAAEKSKWDDVFAAHPDASEIFVAKNGNNVEQGFLERGHALNYASGKVENVKAIQRPLDKAAQAAAAKAAKEAEAAAEKAAKEAEAAAAKAAKEAEAAAAKVANQ